MPPVRFRPRRGARPRPTSRRANPGWDRETGSEGEATRGRRIEAAQRLGIGRNTVTRKIKDLGLDD